jgi:hypothetical protein
MRLHKVAAMEHEPPAYQSYLLRLWRTSDGGEPVWRASLERAGTGERWNFASLEQLFVFLRARISDDDALPEELSE